MSTPLPIRFRDDVLTRLRRRARRIPGATPSGLAQRYVEEGMRTEEFPGLTFKDGPSGRRAALVAGPDVWEVIRMLKEIDERGESAVPAVAELMSLSMNQVQVAARYYGEYFDEIDAEIEDNEEQSRLELRAWEARRALLK